MAAFLEGPRLRLRLLDAGDGGLYARLYGDPATMRFVSAAGDAASLERSFAAACRLNREMPPRRRFWVIQPRRCPAIGLIGLHWDARADAAGRIGAELGVMLPPDAQNRGWAAEAITTLLPHAFDDLGLDRLHTAHAADHALAAGLMRKTGFTRVDDGDDGRWRWHYPRGNHDRG
ncbi:GNAT family N-acetyltransferase [Arenimonas composti]|uniref:N-acetyltransferase domain-containing protein n=1 Tax=Arenimonas composti TR7-09 = DSM 18010 TaxID=1121013 RepID=A0A091B9X9_9GAMM|nr:GNAT family N-acetyltransferase [Arenimonas composti]KFN49428.1 hypothetical protein P873_10670 [Arenimonas composti TR7-09 = DSM 18010]